MEKRVRIDGRTGFLLWAIAGAILAFGIASLPSVGMFVLPMGVVAVVVAARRVKAWPEALGILAGFSSILLLIGVLQSGWACTQSLGECDGRLPLPFLVVGSVLAVASVIAFRVLRKPEKHPWPIWVGLVAAWLVVAIGASIGVVYIADDCHRGLNCSFGAEQELRNGIGMTKNWLRTHESFEGLLPEEAAKIERGITWNSSPTAVEGEVSIRLSGNDHLLLVTRGAEQPACVAAVLGSLPGNEVALTYGRVDAQSSDECAEPSW